VGDSAVVGRAKLEELAAGLRELHRALLAEQRAEYEQLHGPIASGGRLLQLAAHDPSFAWLRVLLEFMADLDALLDEVEPPSDLEAAALRQELEQVFSAADSERFWDRCLPLLQAPSVAMAYARVRTALGKLPAAARSPVPGAGEAQHRWAVARGRRRKR
jgi:hypothetical protein